jgi:two-component sensor histidine kinase
MLKRTADKLTTAPDTRETPGISAGSRADGTILGATNRVVRWAIGTLIVVLVALAVVFSVVQFQATRRAAEAQVHRTAHVVATHYSWVFLGAAQVLRRMSEIAAVSSVEALTPSDINAVVRDLPPGLQHSVYDADGRLLLTSVAEAHAIDISDRPYFVALRDGARFVISPVLTERLTGEQVFVLARRVEDGSGMTGVVTIAIPTATLASMAEALDFEDGSIVSLIRSDGMLLARSPPAPSMDVSAAPVFSRLTSSPDGSYSGVSVVDGERRVVGYWRLDNWPVIAVAAIDEEAVFRDFWHRVRIEFALLLPLIAGALATLIWLRQQQAQDERRERELMRANGRADFLMKEIHHRVKNNLQTVMSLVRLECIPAESKSALLGRIRAMALVHEEIYSVGIEETIPARRYLTRLVDAAVSSHDHAITHDTRIADVRISGERAMQIGLILNEAIANAFKHAFRDRRDGHLEIRLNAEGDTLTLCICDDGPGYDADETDENMGGRLIRSFAGQLGGTIRREQRDGFCLMVDFPADPDSAADMYPA